VLGIGILVGFLLPSRPPARDEAAEKVEPILAEARRRLETPAPPSFEEAYRESSRIETLLTDAARHDPRRAETFVLLGQLLLARGDERALEPFGSVHLLDPSNLDALVGKGERAVTTQLLLHLDRLRWPEVTKALGARLAESQGRSFDALARGLAGGSAEAAFARAYAAIARADWAAAKRALDPVARSALSDRMKTELGYTMFVVDYLADPRVPPAGAWAGLIRGEEGAAFEGGERGVWLLLIRHLERKAALARFPVVRSARHPVHGGILRAEAALHETKGDAKRAAAVLGEAIQAAPDYLQARLARSAALSKAGEKAESERELEAAFKIASERGLPAAALREIRE
jgi:tetratricopeptide (TPR) repeat protein